MLLFCVLVALCHAISASHLPFHSDNVNYLDTVKARNNFRNSENLYVNKVAGFCGNAIATFTNTAEGPTTPTSSQETTTESTSSIPVTTLSTSSSSSTSTTSTTRSTTTTLPITTENENSTSTTSWSSEPPSTTENDNSTSTSQPPSTTEDGNSTSTSTTTTISTTTTQFNNSTDVTPTPPSEISYPDANPGLKNLTSTPVTPNNVRSKLNDSLTYAQMGSSLNPDDVTAISVLVHNASMLSNIQPEVATLLLENVNYMQAASTDTFAESNQPGRGDKTTERIVQAVHNTVKNLEDPNFTYLTGELLGLHATSNSNGDLSIAHNGKDFDLQHSASSVASITIPKAAIDGGNRAYVAYWATNKLFIPAKITYDRSSNQQTTYVTKLTHKDRCSQIITPSGHDPVVTGTVMDKPLAKAVADNSKQLQAIITYNKEKALHPLHSEYKVTWWNTDRQDWSRHDQCEMIQNTGQIVAHCYHLTDFTLVEDGMQNDPLVCNVPLQTIAYILNILSIASLIIFIAFRASRFLAKIRRNNDITVSQVLQDRFIHRIDPNDPLLEDLMYTTFLLIFYIFFTCFKDQRVAHNACQAMGAIAYFLFLCIPFQVFVYAIGDVALRMNYRTVGKYASPMVALSFSVVLSFAITVGLGAGTDFFNREDNFCWIRPTYIVPGIVLPLVFIFSTGLMSTATVAWTIFDNKGGNRDLNLWQSKREKLIRIARIVQMQMHLGLPWIFQFASLAFPYVTAWHFLFSITNDSQGIIHLLIYFIFNKIVKLQKDHESSRPRVDQKQVERQKRMDNDLLENYFQKEGEQTPKGSLKQVKAPVPRQPSIEEFGEITIEEVDPVVHTEHYDEPPTDETYPEILQRLSREGYPRNPRMVEITDEFSKDSQDSQIQEDLRNMEMEGEDEEMVDSPEADESFTREDSQDSPAEEDLDDVEMNDEEEKAEGSAEALESSSDVNVIDHEDVHSTHQVTAQPDQFVEESDVNEQPEENQLNLLGNEQNKGGSEPEDDGELFFVIRKLDLDRVPSYAPPPPPTEVHEVPQITHEGPSDDDSDSEESAKRKSDEASETPRSSADYRKLSWP